MIRINLLPVRAVKKREIGRQILVLFAVVLAGVGAGNFLWYTARSGVRDRGKDQIAKTKQKIAELEKVIGEVNNISKRKQEVEEKLKILDQLRRGRTGPVRMMDALATATPKKVWLKTFEDSGSGVKIEGSAASNDDVAEFMRDLNNIVWTPLGMGRLVEQKRDAKESRVELLGPGAVIQNFPVTDVAAFFTNVELKRTTQKDAVAGTGGAIAAATQVDFELALRSNSGI